MICTNMVRPNLTETCGAPLLSVYSKETGWMLYCCKCGSVINEHFPSPHYIGSNEGELLWKAISFYEDGYYKDAEDLFSALVNKSKESSWLIACYWYMILSRYGFAYGREDNSWTLCKFPLPDDALSDFETNAKLIRDIIVGDKSYDELKLQLDYLQREIGAAYGEHHDPYDVYIDWDDPSISGDWASSLTKEIQSNWSNSRRQEDRIASWSPVNLVNDEDECGKRYAYMNDSRIMLAIIDSNSIQENTRFCNEIKAYFKKSKIPGRIVFCYHDGVARRELPQFLQNWSSEFKSFRKDDDLQDYAKGIAREILEKLRQFDSDISEKKAGIKQAQNGDNNDDPPDDPPIYDSEYDTMKKQYTDSCYAGSKPDKEWLIKVHELWDDSGDYRFGLLLLVYYCCQPVDVINGRHCYKRLNQTYSHIPDVKRTLENPAIRAYLSI